MNQFHQGKVIPFVQNAEFYMKRGAKKMERNDLLAALNRYRQAFLAAPNDTEPCLAVSEILSQMQRYEESNRILLLMMSMGNGTPECYFGLACNYFGMQEYDYAVDSLENYLDVDPDGPFALDAEDFLDFIDDDAAMFEATGLRSDADFDDSAACLFAKNLMNSGDIPGAIDELRRQLEISPESAQVQNQLSLAYFCNGEYARALALTEEALKNDPKDVMARCSLSLCKSHAGQHDEAIRELRTAEEDATGTPEELMNLSALQLEYELYTDAEDTLQLLVQQMPYDENVLHRMGYCAYMLGKFADAQECYKRLLLINPRDTVAKYYLLQSRKTGVDEKGIRAHWMIAYQVPFSETFRRLNQLNRYLSLTKEELLSAWEKEPHFQDLMIWGLTLPEARVKKSILSLLFSFGNEQAQMLMRDFLLHTDQPDDLKRVVFGMLKQLNAKEPYMAYLNGQWICGKVNMMEFQYKLPSSYDNIVQLLLQYMVGVREEECVTASAKIYGRYIESLHQNFPRISDTQQLSMAAALELLGCKQCGTEVSESEIEQAYRISGTRLHNALSKLEPFVEEPEK